MGKLKYLSLLFFSVALAGLSMALWLYPTENEFSIFATTVRHQLWFSIIDEHSGP